MERHIFSVTEVNELVKLLLDNEPMLSGICVRGEISNYKMYPSGHHYFSLKDPTGPSGASCSRDRLCVCGSVRKTA